MPRGVNMQTDSYFKARIEDKDSTGLLALLGTFVGGVVLFLIMGAMGPEVFKTSGKSERMSCLTWDCDPLFVGYLNRLSPLHQVFYLEVTMEKFYDTSLDDMWASWSHNKMVDTEVLDKEKTMDSFGTEFTYEMEMLIEAWGEAEVGGDKIPLEMNGLDGQQKIKYTIHCPANSVTCDPVVVFAVDFLEYPGYHVNVEFVHPYLAAGVTDQAGFDKHKEDVENKKEKFKPHEVRARFEMKYVNRDFTKFQFAVKYGTLTVTVIIASLYIMAMTRQVEQKYWTYEQKWVMGLLVALCGFCDPFYIIEIYTPSIFWTGLATIMLVSMLCLCLMFWLSVFDIVRNNDYWNEQTRTLGMCFYIPKIVIVATIWLFTIYSYLFVRLQTKKDPTFYAGENFAHYSFAKDMTFAACLAYLVYIAVLTGLAVMKALQHQDMKVQFQFVFLLSLIALVIAVIGLSLGAFAPEVIHAAEFTTFFGSVNFYIWIMAYAYYPAGGAGTTERGDAGIAGDHHQFHDELEMPEKHNQAIGQLGEAMDDAFDKDTLGEIRGPMSP